MPESLMVRDGGRSHGQVSDGPAVRVSSTKGPVDHRVLIELGAAGP
jgi:hypothetical protein